GPELARYPQRASRRPDGPGRARLAAATLPDDPPPPVLRWLQHRRDRRVARGETEVRAEAGVQVHQESGEDLLGERAKAMSRENRRKHGSVVPFSSSRAQSRLTEFLETAERLKNERAAAGAVIETVEATPPEAWPALASLAEFQTNAALERLGDEV